MDIFTHALLGATVAAAARPRTARLGLRQRLGLGALAAVFPDVDFAGFLVEPLVFLADWHQGPTHSLLLLPLWASLIGGGYVALTRQRAALADAVAVAALGLAAHIAADTITAYGVGVFQPLSAARVGLGMTYVIDPVFSLIVLAGFVAAARGGRPAFPAIGLGLLCVYVFAQAGLQRQALAVGGAAARAQGLAPEELRALAQPLSPFNWKLIGTHAERYYVAYLNLAGHPPLLPAGLPRLGGLAAAYEPPDRLIFRPRHRYGESPELRALARERWEDPGFAPFRRFAAYPAVSRIHRDGPETCVWFSDLRYDLPALPDTFRYGYCRAAPTASWQLYRLRYFSQDSRQRLSP